MLLIEIIFKTLFIQTEKETTMPYGSWGRSPNGSSTRDYGRSTNFRGAPMNPVKGTWPVATKSYGQSGPKEGNKPRDMADWVFLWTMSGLTIVLAINVIVQIVSWYIFNTHVFGIDPLGAFGGFFVFLVFTLMAWDVT